MMGGCPHRGAFRIAGRGGFEHLPRVRNAADERQSRLASLISYCGSTQLYPITPDNPEEPS